MARRELKSHKKATETNPNVVGDIHSLLNWNADGGLKAADDCAEPDEKVEKSTVAAVEATINYVNHLLNESDEELPEDPEDQVDDEDSSLDDVEDEDEDLGDDEDGEEDDGDVEECGGKNYFSEDDESMVDDEEDEADDEDLDDDDEDEDENLDVDDGEDVEDEDEDEGLEENYFSEGDELEGLDDEEEDEEDGEEEDLDDDEDEEDLGDEEDEEEDMDDVSEGYFFEGDDSESDGLSIDIPEDVDPNDVSVSVGGSEYVPDTGDEGDEGDLGDLDDDALAGDEGDEEEDEDDSDEPVQEGYYPFFEGFYKFGEDDDPDIDDTEPEYGEDELDGDEEEDDGEGVGDEGEEEEPEEEVTESAVMRALRRLIVEGERSDDPITADPSDSTGDSPIDSESDIDDSEAEEKDLSGDEGEVTDGDIPITPGTIQPEEAAELKWMARKLRSIMEGDDFDSHSDGDGKLDAEPLDNDAQDMVSDIGDELADDGELTDTGNGAVDDSETTLGSPDEADDDVEVEGDDVVSSNGERYDTTADEDEKLTDNYHSLMNAIREAYAKKKGKKVKLKKVAKKKGKKKKLSEGSLGDWNPSVAGGDYSSSKYPELTDTPKYSKNYTSNGNGKVKSATPSLEETVLGSFNAQEMTSVLRNLNNAFGTGKIAKEVRDSSVVSEVSVPKWSLPIAENATWDSVGAGKLLSETAYKSESKVNFDLMKKSHLYWENDGSKESDYKFPIASIVEGQAQIIPEAITEATKLFASPSFITRFSESSLKKIRNVLDFYNEKMGKKSPWKENKQINVTEAAKITMIDRTQYNPLMVLKRLSEQEKAKNLINLRG